MIFPDLPGLAVRALEPDDATLLHPLVAAVGEHDGAGEAYTVEDLLDELTGPGLDLPHDGLVVVDGAGAAVAYALVQIPPGDRTLLRAHCPGGVHPGSRGRGIGRRVLSWQLARAAELVAARRREVGVDVPARAMVAVEERAEGAARLAGRLGLELTRWNLLMRRPLRDDDLPRVAVPDGVQVIPWSPDLDDAVRLAHNEAFADHWGFQPWTEDSWRAWQSGHRNFRPEWSLVATDRDEVAGYALSAAWEQDWPTLGFKEGWTNKLGVRRPWRGRGLAKALLVRSMQAFAAGGMASAGLDVDAENLSGAVALYEGLGYRPAHRTATWALAL